VDPFGYYVAEIQEGLNDAFAEKAGSGDDTVDEEAAEKSRKAKVPTVPSTQLPTAFQRALRQAPLPITAMGTCRRSQSSL